MPNTSVQRISIFLTLPMLLLAALIATACESATPDDDSQSDAIAAAAPTPTPPPPTAAMERTQTPSALPQCRPGVYDADSPEAQACRGRPNPVGCPQGRIPPAPWIWDIEDGKVAVAGCLPPPPPPPVYPKLAGGLSKVAELYEGGASVQSAAREASVADELLEDRLIVNIDIDIDPRELVIWLNDNGSLVYGAHKTTLVADEWLAIEGGDIDDHFRTVLLDDYISSEVELDPPYEGGPSRIGASVPVSLLVRLSQRAGVVKVELPFRLSGPPVVPQVPQESQQKDVPPAPQEPQDPVTLTPTPRATSQGQSKHDVTSWHQAGFKGSGVKVGIIDVGFEGFNSGGDLPVLMMQMPHR